MGCKQGHCDTLYPARKAQSECLYRALQSHISHRSPRRSFVRESGTGPSHHQPVADRLQRIPSTRIAGRCPAGAVHAPANFGSESLQTDVYLTGELTNTKGERVKLERATPRQSEDK